MAVRATESRARVDRVLAAMVAGQRMAGAEPDELTVDTARRFLAGEATAGQAIRDGFAAIEAHVTAQQPRDESE